MNRSQRRADARINLSENSLQRLSTLNIPGVSAILLEKTTCSSKSPVLSRCGLSLLSIVCDCFVRRFEQCTGLMV